MFETFAIVALDPEVARELTPGERGVLGALERAVAAFGNPSLAEIASCARSTVFSTPSIPMIHRYLRRLKAKGYVELTPKRARSIRLLRSTNS